MRTDSPLGSHGLNDQAHQDLDTTIAALEGGVTSLAPQTALKVIQVWEDTLRNSEDERLHGIGNLLNELRDALEPDRLDGSRIGGLMLRLGNQTAEAAADADDARMTPRVETLATLLQRAGRALGAEPVEAHQPRVGPAPGEQ